MKIRKLLGYGLVAAVVLANMGLANTVRAASNLRVYDWAGYDNPAFYKPYMDKYQKKPGFSIFAEEEEARAKMKAGFKVDLVHPCSYNANRWRNEGLIQPIDASKLKNYKNLNAKYRNLPGFTVDGKVYIIPYDIGQTALTYNADKVPASDVTTLQAFVNPKYKGKISIPDNFTDWLSLGLLATGTKGWDGITSPDDPRYKKAIAWLRQAHKNNKFYWTDGPTLAAAMKTGEVVMAWAWNETPIALRDAGLNVKMNRDTKEGFSGYVCGYVWAKSSTASPEQVYDFLDAVISTETTMPMVANFGYAHSNDVGFKSLSKDVLAKSVVSNPEKYVNRIAFQTPMPDDVVKFMNDDFNKIKSGN